MTSTTFDSLAVEIIDGVANVTIQHPPLNVLDAVLMTDLDRFAAAIRDDVTVRVIVFQSGDPEFFIPHGDMNFVNDPKSFTNLNIGAGEDAQLNPMQRLHERVRKLPQLTIGKIAGFARGGGAEFLEALDMRFAAIGSGGLAQMEVLTGIIPGGGATVHLPRLMTRARALEVVLGAELFDAELAERYGWINRALPPDELDGFVNTLARRIAGLPPEVVAATKAAIDASEGPVSVALRVQNMLLGQLFAAPASADRTRAALKAGAQTREGERDLEGLLNRL